MGRHALALAVGIVAHCFMPPAAAQFGMAVGRSSSFASDMGQQGLGRGDGMVNPTTLSWHEP